MQWRQRLETELMKALDEIFSRPAIAVGAGLAAFQLARGQKCDMSMEHPAEVCGGSELLEIDFVWTHRMDRRARGKPNERTCTEENAGEPADAAGQLLSGARCR